MGAGLGLAFRACCKEIGEEEKIQRGKNN